MRYQHIFDRFQIEKSDDYTDRCHVIGLFKSFLDCTLYDKLKPFSNEYEFGKYIPILKRRPLVNYPLAKILVNESVSMLFGESRFPNIKSESEELSKFLEEICKNANFNAKFQFAAKIGSVGSVAIILKVIDRKFHLEIVDTQYLHPTFDPLNPNKLVGLRQAYQVQGRALKNEGYNIESENAIYWYVRDIDEFNETIYLPYTVNDAKKEGFIPQIDLERSTNHDLGFIPAVWIRNLPSENVDGECTFEGIIDMSVEINYQLSQLGRLLRYNSDPTMVIKNPAALEGAQIIKGGILELDEDGDAKLLEMSGESTKAVIDYVKLLRDYCLEVGRGSRTTPEKINAAQSGKALQILNYALISLVDEMRLTYGRGLLEILKMITEIIKSKKYDLELPDVAGVNLDEEFELRWGDWYPVTPNDRLVESQALKNMTDSLNLSHESAIASVSDMYNIKDVDLEAKKIENEQKLLYSEGTKVTEVI